jgi:hypothetical protein
VDCVRFVDAVLAELHGYDLPPIPRLDQDLSLHDRRATMEVCRLVSARYPNVTVRGPRLVEPGDVLVYRRGRAPGHVIIVGGDGVRAYHADEGVGVCYTGVGAVMSHVMRIWRPTEKARWCIPLR